MYRDVTRYKLLTRKPGVIINYRAFHDLLAEPAECERCTRSTHFLDRCIPQRVIATNPPSHLKVQEETPQRERDDGGRVDRRSR
jgi:hypothetical protein